MNLHLARGLGLVGLHLDAEIHLVPPLLPEILRMFVVQLRRMYDHMRY